MDKEIFLNQFGHLAQGPDGVKKLRDLILQLAVQGKLVEQDPNDEPASVLFEKAKKDYATALKAKVIKKSRLFSVESSPISGCVPKSWLVLTISQIANVFNGNSVSASDKKSKYSNVSEGHSYIATKDVDFKSHVIDYQNGIKIPFGTPKFKIAPKGAVLICAEGGSAGKKIAITNQDICFGNKLYASVPFTTIIESKFLFYVYKSPQFISQFQEAMTGIIGGISQTSFLTLSVPVPPPSEQKRIVAKVDELMALCEELEAIQETNITVKRDCVASTLHHLCQASEKDEIKSNWSIAENNFGKWFDDLETVKNLRSTILQLAVQGKLVEQDQNDETASDLLNRANIKATKISDDNKPELPIPDSWKWVLLKDITDQNRPISYGVIKLGHDYPGGIKTLRCSDVKYRYIDESSIKTINPDIEGEYKRTRLEGSEVLMNIRGTLGGCAIVPDSLKGANIAREVAMIVPAECVSSEYLLNVISSPLIQELTLGNLRGIAYKGLNLGALSKFAIPLPPLAEQKRIVAKVDELMTLCDELETQILLSQNLNKNLMASLCHHMTVN